MVYYYIFRMWYNGRVQPRCGAQRSNVGCNPLLGGLALLWGRTPTLDSDTLRQLCL